MEDLPGCKIFKKKPGRARCATATEFIERDLKPGEQMCCTKTGVKMPLNTDNPDYHYMCSATTGGYFRPSSAVVQDAIKACMNTGKELLDSCTAIACCKAVNCGFRVVDTRHGGGVGCTATEMVVATHMFPNSQVVCDDDISSQNLTRARRWSVSGSIPCLTPLYLQHRFQLHRSPLRRVLLRKAPLGVLWSVSVSVAVDPGRIDVAEVNGAGEGSRKQSTALGASGIRTVRGYLDGGDT